jgi:hypothetical protein
LTSYEEFKYYFEDFFENPGDSPFFFFVSSQLPAITLCRDNIHHELEEKIRALDKLKLSEDEQQVIQYLRSLCTEESKTGGRILRDILMNIVERGIKRYNAARAGDVDLILSTQNILDRINGVGQ